MNRNTSYTRPDPKAVKERNKLIEQIKQRLKVEYGLKSIRVMYREEPVISFLGDGPNGFKTYKYDVVKDEIREPSYVTSEQWQREQAQKEVKNE